LHRRNQTLSLALLLLTVGGCSNHLSRSNANNQIEREIQRGQAEESQRVVVMKFVNVGRIEEHCFSQGLSVYDPVEKNDYKALAQSGFVTVKSMGTHSWDVSLTDAGKTAMVGAPYAHKQQGLCDYWQVSLALAKWDTFNVTGIREDGPHAKANITIVWKLTPLGRALKKEAAQLNLSRIEAGQLLSGYALADISENASEYHQYQSVLFDKYGDGWRMREPQEW
jgi:hypothetical protein